jgi:hypothetical protein
MMSYIVEVTTIKPAEVKFFGESNPGIESKSGVRAKSVQGFIAKRVIKPDENTVIKTLEFDSEASFREYDSMVKESTSSGFLQKKEYNLLNNIITTIKVLGQ